MKKTLIAIALLLINLVFILDLSGQVVVSPSFQGVQYKAQVPIVSTTDISLITTTSAQTGGTVINDNGSPVTVRGVVFGITENPTIENNDGFTTDGEGLGVFVSGPIGLTPGTTYYVRAYATNVGGTGYGNQVSFTTINNRADIVSFSIANQVDETVINLDIRTVSVILPIGTDVSSLITTFILSSGATVQVNEVDQISGETANDFTNPVIYVITAEDLTTISDWVVAVSVQFCETFSNLDHTGSSYLNGTFLGQDGSTWTYEKCRGDLTITEKAIAFGYNQSPLSNVYSGLLEGSIGMISFDYKKAFSTNVNLNLLINDIVVGNVTSTEQNVVKSSGNIAVTVEPNAEVKSVIKFVNTSGGGQVAIDNICWSKTFFRPTLTTTNVTGITTTSASTGGSITNDGGLTITSRGLVYGTSQKPTIESNEGNVISGNGSGEFTSELTGLSSNTIYYARAYATNSAGTAYGNQVTFTTINDKAEFISFRVTNQATIEINSDAGTIAIIVPFGTDLSALISSFTLSSAAVAKVNDVIQVSGESVNDFTTPIVYIVTAQNNTTKRWVVQITPKVLSTFETFDNLTATPYTSGTFLGQDGSTWTYEKCGSSSITGKAILFGRNQTPLSNVYSGSLSGGIGALTFDFKKAFSTDVNLNVLVNDIIVGNVTSAEENVIKYSGKISVNIEGDAVIKFSNPTGGGQVVIDNIYWTHYPVAPDSEPVLTTTSVTGISATTATTGGNITSDGGLVVTARGVVYSTSENPTVEINEGITDNGVGTGSFTSELTGLIPGTTYFVRAYATNSLGTAYGEQVQYTTLAPCADMPTVTDIDGNVYNTVQIGEQCWMKENLKVTSYNDDTSIPTGYTNEQWAALTTGAYAVYPHSEIDGLNSDSEVLEAYGALYNWYAVEDAKGVCPTGWRVPSDNDWVILEGTVDTNFDINDPEWEKGGWRGYDAGLKLKSKSGWIMESYAGNDEFGFNSLGGGGIHYPDANFWGTGITGYYWSTSVEYNTSMETYNVYIRATGYDFPKIARGHVSKISGFSIRCIKD